MKGLPRISIVTPSYNQGSYIEETICSVLDQGYPDLEYIIIDGGSTDNSVEIIKKYSKHLKHWVSEPDSGQSNAINKGLSQCTGEIFNWLNSDDLLMPDSLYEIAEGFNDPTVEIFSGREIHFNKTNEIIKNGSIIYPDLEQNLLNGVIYQPSTFWRLQSLMPLLPLNEHLHYLMDTLLWINYILSCGTAKIKKSEKILAKFRLHEASKTVGLSGEFAKERWLLRYHVLKHVDSEFGVFESLIEQKLKNYVDVKFQQLGVSVDLAKFRKILAEELCYEYYRDREYQSAKSVLERSIENGIFTINLLKYFIRLNLIPKKLLERLRNDNS